MMTAVWFFLLGTSVFGIGIGIGWSMRGSVKEENTHQVRVFNECIQRINWGIDDLKKRAR